MSTPHEKSMEALDRMEAAQRAWKAAPIDADTGRRVELLDVNPAPAAPAADPDPGEAFAAELRARMGWQSGGPAL